MRSRLIHPGYLACLKILWGEKRKCSGGEE
jgi:hypothetical protein